jgi:hypothetical protein
LDEIIRQRFASIQPLPIFHTPNSVRTLHLVIDEINQETVSEQTIRAVILSALISNKRNRDLRIITRNRPAHKQTFRKILQLHGIRFEKNTDFLFLPLGRSTTEVSVGDDDLFMTTSWKTTRSVQDSFGERNIIYLLQRDERKSNGSEEDQLRSSEVLHSPQLKFVINTKSLYDDFVAEGFENIVRNGHWFESACPRDTFYYDSKAHDSKRHFIFHADPNQPETLFYFGLEAIDMAFSRGILDPLGWDIFLLGNHIPKFHFSNSCSPKIIQGYDLAEYATLIRSADLGLCLSYDGLLRLSCLELAASGSVVVTNSSGLRQDGKAYSKNILSRELQLESIVSGLEDGTKLLNNPSEHLKNYKENEICDGWETSFDQVLSRFGD